MVDIDEDGTPELLVKTGIEEDELKYEVFTYTNKLVNLGEIEAVNSLLYDGEKVIMRQVTNQGYEKIYHIGHIPPAGIPLAHGGSGLSG